MKCPRCKTENENRTICKKCGYYMYTGQNAPHSNMTAAQIRAADFRIASKKVSKVLLWVWRCVVIVVMTFWIIALILFLTGQLN